MLEYLFSLKSLWLHLIVVAILIIYLLRSRK